MASLSQDAIARPMNPIFGRNGLVDRYFYFAMSLLLATVVIAGFRISVDQSLFHAAPPRPLLLWVHGAAFSAWIVFYISQSVLVRTGNVKWHRLLGWFGTALAATMVPLGVIIAVVMGRFDAVVLHQPDPTFLSIPFFDMVAFAILVSLAIAWRKKVEPHRRLLFIATCSLMDAGFGRFPYIFNHALFYWFLDGIILLGVARDLLVNRRVHAVYRYAIPMLIAGQAVTLYLWRSAPAWWSGMTHRILGLS